MCSRKTHEARHSRRGSSLTLGEPAGDRGALVHLQGLPDSGSTACCACEDQNCRILAEGGADGLLRGLDVFTSADGRDVFDFDTLSTFYRRLYLGHWFFARLQCAAQTSLPESLLVRYSRSPQTPNKAPEPTPGLVTPRALVGIFEMKRWNEKRDVARGAPSPGVAHL